MSKYVPAFLKEQQQQTNTSPTSNSHSDSIWSRSNRRDNSSNDFPMNRRERPDTMDTPRRAFTSGATTNATTNTNAMPATLASLTSGSGGWNTVNNKGNNKSYASKFSNQVRVAQDPNYVPPPKPLDINSQEDFPTLGGKPQATSKPKVTQPTNKASTIRQTELADAPKPAGKWANMAKAWAQQDEDEKEAARLREVEEENYRKEMEILNAMHLPTFNHHRRNNYYDEEELDEGYNQYEEEEADSYVYESSETEEEPSDNDNQETPDDEYNSNTVWDGRRKDDLY
jgi:hypothetical protein